MLTHINKRLNSRPNVLLPVAALLTQFNNPELSPQAAVSLALSMYLVL